MCNNSETPDLTLSVLSDIHVTWFDEFHYEGAANLERALKFHKEHLYPSDAYLFTGDTVYQVESSQKSVCEVLYTKIYDRALGIMNRYIPKNVPRFMIMGNHEYPQCNTKPEDTAKAQELFRNAYHQELFFHETVKGYHIIGASIQSWAIPQCDKNEAFIMAEAEKAIAEDPMKPVFVMLHNPIPGTTTFSGKYTRNQYSEAFMQWLYTKPQILVLSGHCHNVNEDDSCIYQNGYTQVNIPIVAVGYMRFDGNGAPGFQNDYGNYFGKSQSVQITVKNNVVTIRSYDVTLNKEVNVWTVDIPGLVSGKTAPLYSEEAHAAWPAPVFGEKAALAVTDTENGKVLRIRQDFLPYPYCKKYYTIVFCHEATGDTTTVTYPTDYFKGAMAEEIEKPVPALPKGRYTVSVYICNSFAKKCDRPLVAEMEI